ncbi:Not1 N-terminal domain, CCR4-Not complex component-domain-containing protein [Mycotypha africana]|uniref:Not1 N-terminal domain, CCR4-Not complex component-domain-containing protein n=1 Tax=Mycotypha africana TaxID=64632 RepID=UPI0022FFCCB8|nr:Not1 N-terminal domain, CCR4-Not complex component-domain-containing protein [Mycotypha africana]KAI8975636.1 Not1 N-terminal domain, CCR4-Not complex component-domain-containing protein [Mycotypha africana]
MSLKRLQAEVDRLLKKVNEGIETFEYIYDKIQSASSSNQKDKYEQDLKKEIKKLQRFRDQIKTHLANNDIKDKRSLLEKRKLIEALMERFKQVEREMKTKAFSKEGLLQRERLDPKEKEKVDACDFVNNTVEELSRQIETVEFEIEQLESSGSKRGKKADHQKAEHVSELEHLNERRKYHINRLELILRLLENDHLAPERVNDLKDAIQYYVECNGEPDFEEDEGLYDELDLEKEEELYDIRTDEFHSKSDSEEDENEKENVSAVPTPAQSPKKTRASAKAVQAENISATVKDTSSLPTPVQSQEAPAPTAATATPSSKTADKDNVWAERPKIADQDKATSEQQDNEATKSPTEHDLLEDYNSPSIHQLPPSLADLAPSFQAIKNKHKHDIQYATQMLNASLQHVPDLIDSERPKVYQPRNPYNTPDYYPQQPLLIFDNPVIFDKFDMDTLFYIFYYQQGTYQQYLAARELKKQSWRFHKKYLTWFQRHEEPKVITEDYEQGTYIYFDYENAWCQRKKMDFRFDYNFLEEA